jgi:hypothetical protein
MLRVVDIVLMRNQTFPLYYKAKVGPLALASQTLNYKEKAVAGFANRKAHAPLVALCQSFGMISDE